MEQTCSELPHVVCKLASLLMWKEHAGLVVAPGLTNIQAQFRPVESKGSNF